MPNGSAGSSDAERNELALLREIAELLDLWRTDALPGLDPIYRKLALWKMDHSPSGSPSLRRRE